MIIYILFFIGFAVLIYGAHLLVEGAGSLGIKMGMSQIVIGLTIVALGTSLPELFINIFASVKGSTGLVIGNVLGSNIVNTFLIIGVAALIYPIKVNSRTSNWMIPGTIFATLVLYLLSNDALFGRSREVVSFADGIVLLIFFGAFMYFTMFGKDSAVTLDTDIKMKNMPVWRSGLYILLGITGLYFGGDWIVTGAEKISDDFGVGQSVVGLTLVALATSLPELVTSVIAASKQNSELAIGNAVGSNIFNIFMVLGISALIRPIPFEKSLNFEIWITVAAGLLLLIFVKWTGKEKNLISRLEGALLILAYCFFLYYSFTVQAT